MKIAWNTERNWSVTTVHHRLRRIYLGSVWTPFCWVETKPCLAVSDQFCFQWKKRERYIAGIEAERDALRRQLEVEER